MWKWGRAAAEALLSRPRPERHLTVPAALPGPGVGGYRGGDARPAAPAPHKARGVGATAAPPPRERLEARGCPRADSGGRPQAFVCWFRAAFLAGWLPVTEVIHSFQNCLGAGVGAGAEPARGCSPPLPSHNRFSPSARPARRCRPGGTRGGGRRCRFQRRKWLLDARERLICNWGRADWCSWRRRGGRSGGGGGGWPLSNGEGGGGDVAAEGAALGCATRRCHHCTGANSGGGAGSYFPLLPRCCFCRRGSRGKEGGRGRRRGPACTRAGGGSRAVCSLRGAAAQLPTCPHRPPGVPAFSPQTPPHPPLPRRAPHPGVLPALVTPPPQHPGPGFPTPGSPSRARRGGRSPGAG